MDPSQRQFITVVSGLPRSGTSMMMQMIDAGGIPALTDNIRAADPDNPRGYFELEPIKNLKDDASCLQNGIGRAVKILHLLLPHLPSTHQFRVILMLRDMRQILASQKTMLQRQGKALASITDQQLASAFERQLQQVQAAIGTRPNIRVLEIQHASVLRDPAACASTINHFLEGGLDVGAMAAMVDRDLHRQRQ